MSEGTILDFNRIMVGELNESLRFFKKTKAKQNAMIHILDDK